MRMTLAVMCCGTVGSIARYALDAAVQRALVFSSPFPWGTLCVNLIGCFLLAYGLHTERVKKRLGTIWHTAAMTGGIGSFTTFSTVSAQAMHLIADERYFVLFSYWTASIAGGLSLAACGYWAAKMKAGDPR